LSCDTAESHLGWIEDIKAYNKVTVDPVHAGHQGDQMSS
jgi:alkyl hydroperoxide reductase subunit AhpC